MPICKGWKPLLFHSLRSHSIHPLSGLILTRTKPKLHVLGFIPSGLVAFLTFLSVPLKKKKINQSLVPT